MVNQQERAQKSANKFTSVLAYTFSADRHNASDNPLSLLKGPFVTIAQQKVGKRDVEKLFTSRRPLVNLNLDTLYDLSHSKQMSLESILLAVLKEPATGYELKQAFQQTLRHFWSADIAQIYRTLQHLEKAGQLKSKEAPSQKGPSRRIYQRTSAGTKQLKKWLASAPQLGNERLSHIAQLVFMHELDDLHQTLKFVESLKAEFAQTLKVLETIAASEPHKDLLTMPAADFHGSLGLQMGLDTLRLKLQWCDRSIATIKKRLKFEESQ